ncbi:YgaP family membrane protein [Sulfurospirillum arcachonense]|uniref:YgaP family membrane protein n=1 Tax=Sulfurospirillum arcachonense TaxID=57666 RepID=UPI00046A3A83|nr:DUF2892 domain-containing protein [Sulfurospirillum arcachonense]
MKRNVGTLDRFLRLMIGIPIMVYGFFHSIILLVVGAVIFITGALGWCGLYTLIGLDSCKSKNSGKDCEL